MSSGLLIRCGLETYQKGRLTDLLDRGQHRRRHHEGSGGERGGGYVKEEGEPIEGTAAREYAGYQGGKFALGKMISAYIVLQVPNYLVFPTVSRAPWQKWARQYYCVHTYLFYHGVYLSKYVVSWIFQLPQQPKVGYVVVILVRIVTPKDACTRGLQYGSRVTPSPV